jgi:hypothetical protein
MSNIRSLKKTNFEDMETSKLQENISNWVDAIIRKETLNGLRLERVSLSAGSNDVPHRLGRKLIGWQVVRQRSAATIYDEQDGSQFTETLLKLNSSAPVIVDLWVF